MTAVAGRVWGWVSPVVSYRPWGRRRAVTQEPTSEPTTEPTFEPTVEDTVVVDEGRKSGRWGWRGLTSWVWRGGKGKGDQAKPVEEFYFEAEEKIQSMEIEDLCAGKQEATTTLLEPESTTPPAPRWWHRLLPPYPFWSGATEASGLPRRKCIGWSEGAWDSDNDGDLSDYGTPPPSPTPPPYTLSSPFRFFAQSWKWELLPEHYEICFNFLRHLFDLVVVGFLWTVSPPTKVILEVLGVQGGLKLWLHGMAMFFVSTVGLAGLLWVVQEYLPEFALIYGIVQAVVISVSVRQSVILGGGEAEEVDEEGQEVEVEEKKETAKEKEEKQQQRQLEEAEEEAIEAEKEAERQKDIMESKEVPVFSKKKYLSAKERLCFERVGI